MGASGRGPTQDTQTTPTCGVGARGEGRVEKGRLGRGGGEAVPAATCARRREAGRVERARGV